jgi:arylsulfatase A-like enzyme
MLATHSVVPADSRQGNLGARQSTNLAALPPSLRYLRFLLCICLVLLSATDLFAAPRPNIVLIMSDDMGFSDLGCYGGEIQTPTLDRLAAGGLRLTQFYNTARCCPTRAALLTGLYPHQAGIGHMMEDKGFDGYRGDLNRQCATTAEVLRPAGYGTFAVGKWHVTKATQPDGRKDNWPLQRGFDRFYGTITGAGNFFDPGTLTRDNTMISPVADAEYKPQQYYYTDAISDHAVRFIGDHHQRAADKPLFLYVAYTAAHWPMHAREEDIAKYKGKYDRGYEPVRRARLERMKQLGLVAADAELTPTAGDWERMENKAWESRCMEVYAAMIDRMDQGISRIVAELQRTGRLDNTLLFFLQDNGGCAETVGRQLTPNVSVERPAKPPLEPQAAGFIDTAVRPTRTRDGYHVRTGPGAMPGPHDTFIAYGQGWANVSNTPHREYKHWVHEGGISTPLIVHWPAEIKRRGELVRTPGHLIDIMATCVDVSGASYPQEQNRQAIQPLEGKSLVPAFDGQPIDREAIYWEHEGNRAIRVGNWKLVAKGPAGKWELYDIDRDRAELHDLASQQPERVQQMVAQWETWAKRANVIPWIWEPQYGEKATAGKKEQKAAKKAKQTEGM